MIDKTKLTKAVKDKYSFKDETFLRVAKDNPKDKVEVEIGDSKQPDFKPQVKVAGYTGRKHSDEAKAKMRAAKLGKSLPKGAVRPVIKLVDY